MSTGASIETHRGEFRERLTFERGARSPFPSMTTNGGPGSGYAASVVVNVPGYEERRIRIIFNRQHPQTPLVFADGPSQSPHRYPMGRFACGTRAIRRSGVGSAAMASLS